MLNASLKLGNLSLPLLSLFTLITQPFLVCKYVYWAYLSKKQLSTTICIFLGVLYFQEA